MLKNFRNSRKSMLKNNKITAYILYAIGEIILVMIGILLALQVNNWNEKRSQQKELNNTLRAISYDLAIDTTSASRIITFYEENQKNSLKIINRELNMDNYRECPQCLSLVTIYQPFIIQQKGYEFLKASSGDHSTQKDSLIIDITEVYSQLSPLISKSNERMENEILGNFNDLKAHSWFVELFQAKFNDEMISYFVESEDYRKRVAAHSILAAGNHLSVIKLYKANANQLLKSIDERLNIK